MRNADAADDGEALAPMEEGGASSSASGQRRADSDDVDLRQGSEVRLRNLVANASLNGTAGVIREWDAGTAKWVVVLITGNVVRVKPDNVEEFKELSGGGDGEGEEARDPRVPDQPYCPSRRARRMHRALGTFRIDRGARSASEPRNVNYHIEGKGKWRGSTIRCTQITSFPEMNGGARV